MGFDKSMEKLIGGNRRKPQISATAKMTCISTLRERFQETTKHHSRNAKLVLPELLRSYKKTIEPVSKMESGDKNVTLNLC